jgi:hypothetical protein
MNFSVYLSKNATRHHYRHLLVKTVEDRSHYTRGLRCKLSSPAQTLGSWVRFELEPWMFAFILFVFLYVSNSPATG